VARPSRNRGHTLEIGDSGSEALVQRTFKLSARVSSDNPSAIRTVLKQFLGSKRSVKATDEGFEVEAELTGESARDLNRMLLSQMRRVERRTRLRAEWTADGVTERFFDYVPKGRRKTHS
jgi:hypothetical protein